MQIPLEQWDDGNRVSEQRWKHGAFYFIMLFHFIFHLVVFPQHDVAKGFAC